MLFLKKKLGARIQEIRKSKKLTQENLAEMLGVSYHMNYQLGALFTNF